MVFVTLGSHPSSTAKTFLKPRSVHFIKKSFCTYHTQASSHALPKVRFSGTMTKEMAKDVLHTSVMPIARSQQTFSKMFWIANGLTYVPAAILTPWMTNQQLKHDKNISERERHLLVHQEISRQAIGALIHFLNYYPAVLTTQALQWLGEKTPALQAMGTFLKHESHQAWSNLALVTVMNTLGYGLLRPGVVNYTLQKTLKPSESTSPSSTHEVPPSPDAIKFSQAPTKEPVLKEKTLFNRMPRQGETLHTMSQPPSFTHVSPPPSASSPTFFTASFTTSPWGVTNTKPNTINIPPTF
jgi:hypothetical protein